MTGDPPYPDNDEPQLQSDTASGFCWACVVLGALIVLAWALGMFPESP